MKNWVGFGAIRTGWPLARAEINRKPVNNTYLLGVAKGRQIPAMVRKKKLSPSGAKDDNGEYHNVHVNLHEDELAVAGMDIGDEVFVRVRDGKIIIQKADTDSVEHDF